MSEKTLYLECYSGISGDMTVAALLDLGADQTVLLDGLNSLKVDGYHIEIGRKLKSSIDVCDFNVILYQDLEHSHEHVTKHNHDNEDSYGHELELEHNHSHNHNIISEHSHSHDIISEHNHIHSHDISSEHNHSHSHDISLEHNHTHSHELPKSPTHQHETSLILGHHEHRNLSDINKIIECSAITENAKILAKKIFHIIAIAEAKAHSKP